MKDINENSHLNEEQIAEIADAMNKSDLDSLPKHYLDHIKDCDQCADEVMLISDIVESPEIMQNSSTKNTDRSIKLFLAFAASIALILASYYIFIKPQSPNPNMAETNDTIINKINNNDNIAEIDTLIKVDKDIDNDKEESEIVNKNIIRKAIENEKNQIAFQEHKDLEELFNRFNTSTMRNAVLKIKSDSILEISTNDSIHIEWEKSDFSYSIQILDNQAKELIVKDDLESNFKSNNTLDLGLYYWKILDEDYNLVYCGKLLVVEQK